MCLSGRVPTERKGEREREREREREALESHTQIGDWISLQIFLTLKASSF
jgi:hypothetical protein